MEVCEHLPSTRIDVMTSPNTWQNVPSEKFHKATLIRCHLAANSCRLDNSLFWLNPIVDNITKFEKLVKNATSFSYELNKFIFFR